MPVIIEITEDNTILFMLNMLVDNVTIVLFWIDENKVIYSISTITA